MNLDVTVCDFVHYVASVVVTEDVVFVELLWCALEKPENFFYADRKHSAQLAEHIHRGQRYSVFPFRKSLTGYIQLISHFFLAHSRLSPVFGYSLSDLNEVNHSVTPLRNFILQDRSLTVKQPLVARVCFYLASASSF